MILERIVADNIAGLEERKGWLPLSELKTFIAEQAALALDMEAALRAPGTRLIAEIKKASPSKGVIRKDFDPGTIAAAYARGGTAAISILTESQYFMGNLDYLKEARLSLEGKNIPLLRKDFIHDPYQVYESRYYGADAILLIVAVLKDKERLSHLLGLAHELGMQALVEVHDEAELEIALNSPARIIGINNRDLKTFHVDLEVTERLCGLIPAGYVIVSESGIHSRSDISRLKELGVNAFLVGEALMASADIEAKMKDLI
jgi:indole-3-glycerol phosphate synthase